MPTARTPEELDALLEDAFVLGRQAEFGVLFEREALVVEARGSEARGASAIGEALMDLRAADRTYVSRPRRVLQSRGTALIVADGAIHVLVRGSDLAWRSVISLLDLTSRPMA